MEFDLEAFRCPDATIKMKKVLQAFAKSGVKSLSIATIEPSMRRNIVEFIAFAELPLKLDNITTQTVTREHIEKWKENFDEIDYSDIDQISCFTLIKL